MNETDPIERRLAALPRSAVPPRLDQRAQDAFRQAHRQRQARVLTAPVPLWACTCACLLCLTLGLRLTDRGDAPRLSATVERHAPPAVITLECPPDLRDLLVPEALETDFLRRPMRLVGENTEPEAYDS